MKKREQIQSLQSRLREFAIKANSAEHKKEEKLNFFLRQKFGLLQTIQQLKNVIEDFRLKNHQLKLQLTETTAPDYILSTCNDILTMETNSNSKILLPFVKTIVTKFQINAWKDLLIPCSNNKSLRYCHVVMANGSSSKNITSHVKNLLHIINAKFQKYVSFVMMYTYLHVYIYLYVYSPYVCMYVCMYVYIYIYICIHIYMQ